MNCVYQYWINRPLLPGANYGMEQMAAYAAKCGAYHRACVHDAYTDRMGLDPRWWDKLRLVFDPFFDGYERILIADVDVFPVDGVTANIFDEPVGDFGMVEEPDQPEFRDRWPSPLFNRKADEAWAAFVERSYGCKVPRDAKGRPRTWNAGVILLTREGRQKLATIRPQPKEYVDACRKARLLAGVSTEQGYLNMIAALPGIDFTQLSLEWNRTIQKIGDGSTYDRRTADTKFVHVMLRAADHNDAAWHHEIVNSHLKPAIVLPPHRSLSILYRPLY